MSLADDFRDAVEVGSGDDVVLGAFAVELEQSNPTRRHDLVKWHDVRFANNWSFLKMPTDRDVAPAAGIPVPKRQRPALGSDRDLAQIGLVDVVGTVLLK